jgi:hypothetical protein
LIAHDFVAIAADKGGSASTTRSGRRLVPVRVRDAPAMGGSRVIGAGFPAQPAKNVWRAPASL